MHIVENHFESLTHLYFCGMIQKNVTSSNPVNIKSGNLLPPRLLKKKPPSTCIKTTDTAEYAEINLFNFLCGTLLLK